MSATLTLIDLTGEIVLLLWGVRMVQNGIQRAGGQSLRHYMQAHLSCSFRALRERRPLRHLIMQVKFRREPNLEDSRSAFLRVP